MRPRHKTLLTGTKYFAPVTNHHKQLRLISRLGPAGRPNDSLDPTILRASTNAGPEDRRLIRLNSRCPEL
jgi:hypothetical protein